jgi:hypothetical protein
MHLAIAAQLTALAGLSLSACGGGGATQDASIDMPPGSCGANVVFTGDVVDWDATTNNFCGVFNARLTVRGQSAQTDDTNPNGRFELCVPHQAQTPVDVTHSADPSQCLGVNGAYVGRGVLLAEQDVIDASGGFSARALTQARQDAMFTQIGQPYSGSKAQLVVHVNGTPRPVSISASAAHAAVQRFNGTAWAAGDTGSEVFFPNVDPGAVQITVAGGATGAGTVTLEAGAYTYLSVIAN